MKKTTGRSDRRVPGARGAEPRIDTSRGKAVYTSFPCHEKHTQLRKAATTPLKGSAVGQLRRWIQQVLKIWPADGRKRWTA